MLSNCFSFIQVLLISVLQDSISDFLCMFPIQRIYQRECCVSRTTSSQCIQSLQSSPQLVLFMENTSFSTMRGYWELYTLPFMKLLCSVTSVKQRCTVSCLYNLLIIAEGVHLLTIDIISTCMQCQQDATYAECNGHFNIPLGFNFCVLPFFYS